MTLIALVLIKIELLHAAAVIYLNCKVQTVQFIVASEWVKNENYYC